MLLFIGIFIIIINKIKIQEEKRKSCPDRRKMKKNDLSYSKTSHILLKNISENTSNLNFDKNYNYEYIEININKRNKGKAFLIRNIFHLRTFIELLKYIIVLNLFNNILLNNKFSFICYKSYNISLKIKGNDIKNIFTSTFYFKKENYPDEVYINGYKQNDVKNQYNLSETDNFIELIWNKLINDLQYIFYGCSNITEIDFSKFNTSKVENMS